LRYGPARRIIRAVSAPQGKRLALAMLVAAIVVAVAVAAPGLAAAPRRPDLTVKALSTATPSVAPGGKLAITAKVADPGPGKAAGSTLAAYLGKARKHSRSDVKLGTIATPALRPGKTAALKGSLTVPASTASGSYTLLACADSAAKVKEKSEADNCRAGATVQVGPAGGGAKPGGGGGQPGDKGSPAPGTGSTPGGATTPPGGGGETPSEPPHEEPHELPSEEPGGGGLPGSGEPVPPPPAPPQATPLASEAPTPFGEATDFLYEGPDPVQTGVEDEAIEPARAGVLRGRVLATDGTPLPSVTVTVLDHPELGQTVTRSDGRYDLAVNSGGAIVLLFERPTFLPVEREIDPAVRDYENVEDVAMKHFDQDVTMITPNASTVQVAQSTITHDESGERRSTLIFMPGTTADMRLPDGSTKPLKTLRVRATEYTVGAHGPEAMPGELPPTSAYTFAANYSVDEAVEAGATGVEFNQPVPIYTDDFLGMPVGTDVPLGSYDMEKGEWIPEADGRVLKIVAIVGGKAELDVDGDGNADPASTLAALGISAEEREALATVYGVGKELWRVQVTHFSAWDWNWCVGPPREAHPPEPPPPRPERPHDPKDPLPPCNERTGSSVDCDSQALREQLPVSGTPFTLDYTSSRAEGVPTGEIEIPVTEADIPSTVRRVTLDIEVAGQVTHMDYAPAPNLSYTYRWNGRDAYGRPVVGSTKGTATITYFYPQVYDEGGNWETSRFAGDPGVALDVVGREEFEISQTVSFTLAAKPVTPPSGLGGWSLDVDNALDPVTGVVELGTGGSMPAPVTKISRLLANPSLEATYPETVAMKGATWQPDGSVWFLEEYATFIPGQTPRAWMKVRRVAPDGASISTIATLPEPALGKFYGGNPSIVAAPDGGAWVLAGIEHVMDAPVWHVSPGGALSQVTGGEEFTEQAATPNAGDGMPASQVVLEEPRSLVLGPDGSLYVGGLKRLQHINGAGILETVYEKGVGPGQFALAIFQYAFGPDGSLYLLEAGAFGNGQQVIDRLYPSGKKETVVGGGDELCCVTGQTGTSVHSEYLGPLAVGPNQELIFASLNHLEELEVSGDKIRQLAGSPDTLDFTDGGPALGTDVANIDPMDVAPDGRIVTPTARSGLRTVEPGIPGSSLRGYTIPAANGREVFRFDPSGRQTETVDVLTGVPLETFSYTADGVLRSVTDRDGRTTTIERNAAGEPTAIVAPTGERTTVSLDAEGDLATVKRPGLPETHLTYKQGGFLTGETDADGGTHVFTYDPAGYVIGDRDPDGVDSMVSATVSASGRTVKVTSPLGRATTYENGGSEEAGFDRTVTTSSGAQTVTTVAPSGATSGTFPDGSKVSTTLGADPRFGALGHFTKEMTIKEPSGLTAELVHERTTTLTDESNPFSVGEYIDKFKVGERPPLTLRYLGPSRTLTVTEPDGAKQETVKFDAKGHVVSIQEDAAETPATIAVNGDGMVTETVQGAQKHEYTYDSHDHLATSTDALGHTSHHEYDAAGRLTSTETPGGEKYLFEHDALENLTKLTEPSGAASHLSFTPGGRVKTFVPPGSGGGYVNAYDADGQIESTTLPGGRTITYGHDGGGRVDSIGYPEATVGVGYVGNGGRVASLTRTPAGGGSAEGLALGYDGSLLKSTEWTGPGAGAYGFTYDSNLQLSQTKASAGAASFTTAMRHDEDGRVTEEGPFRLGRSGPQGAITEISGGPFETSQAWDGLGRLESRTDTVAGNQNYKMVLTRDAAGRLTQKVESVAGVAHTYTYGYDADDRLTDVHRDGTLVEHYAYDADGNRTTREVEGASKTATYDAAGLITGLGGTGYTTNADGFVIARGADAFTYAARGELLSATVGGTTETYAYDGYGRLVARTVGGNTWRYLYGNPEQELQVTAAVEPDGTLDTLSYTDTGYLYSILRGSTRYYVSTDQVGSPRVVTDAAGNVVKKVDYSAFGEVLSDSAPSFEIPLGYAVGVADPQAGIVHMGLRPYDPASGRFMARDPLGLGGGQANLFAYSGDEPIQHSDPLGLGSTSLGLCEGFCVGIKFAVTSKGFSACTEIGLGSGNEFEITPTGELDENKVFVKATASGGFGSLLGGELGIEASVSDKCRETKAIGKVCTLGGCLTPEGLAIEPTKVKALFTKPKAELDAKVTTGVCQAVLW
jgi:RHS repeat-associated protein